MANVERVPCTRRVRTIQHTSLLLIFIICVVSYMDRGTLSVANPLIRNELGLSVAEMGVLLSAFLWPYAFTLLLAGAIVDRGKPRRVLTVALIVWSVAQGAAGFIANYGQFLAARALLGVGEAPMFPTAARVVKDWYHESDQALGVGIWNGAPSLGTAIAPALLTPLMLVFGWRWMFVIMAVVGFVLAAIWFSVYRDFDAQTLDEMDRHYLYTGGEIPEAQPVHAAAWGKLFSFRATWGLILGFFGNVYIGWLFIAWLPGYLELQRHMSIPKTGFVASVPFVFGLIGSILGGYLADRLTSRGMTSIASRKLLTVIGMVAMSLATFVAAETASNVIAVGSISVAIFFGFSASGTSWSLANACAPPSYAASLGAIMDFGGFIGGALAPMVTGFVVQATGSFTPALLVAGVIGLCSAGAYVIFIPTEPIRTTTLAGRLA
ncbi:MFS transporter [Acidisphaera sp. S103]|uniref:MFS transporter n=1 Tax=Acidisphaera sp. S103 TaxID=1747223 RepID=UPI00131ACE16|nr:MFS transporter [Acidisphaera sp. S103]